MTATPTTEAQLAQILDWAAYLPALLTRHAPTGDGSRSGRRTPGSKPPVRLDILHLFDTRLRVTGDDAEDRAWHDRMASDHRQGLLPDLWQWCRLIEAEAMDSCPEPPDELPEQPTLASVVAWLIKHTPWALSQPWAGEYVTDVDWWWRKLRNAMGEAAVARDVPCSRCHAPLTPVHDGRWECCSGHTVTIHAVGLREAAREVEVNYETLRRWLGEENVVRLDESGGRPVYDLGEVRRVVAGRKLRDAVV